MGTTKTRWTLATVAGVVSWAFALPVSAQAPDAEPPIDARAAYSPDGGRIAFISRHRDGNADYGLYVARADGTGLSRLPVAAGLAVKGPAWSPDGTEIAYFAGARGASTDVMVIAAGGTGERRLTDDPASDHEPCWSPDGSRLVFASDRGGAYQLYVVGADGGAAQRLLRSTSNDMIPEWSARGAIAFISDRDGTSDVWTMNADGTALRQVTSGPSRDWAPTWSPDGTRLAFHRNDPAIDGGRNWDVYVARADGTGLRRITRDPGEDLFPSWSPRGDGLIFESERLSGRLRIVTHALGGTDRQHRFRLLDFRAGS